MEHSYLQFGGFPINPWRQVQDGTPLLSRQSALRPHGEGLHGSLGSGSGAFLIS